MMSRLALLVALAGGTMTSVQGQTVYRCGADGRLYQSTPCEAGRAVDVGDSRSDEQRRQASEVAQRERQLADQLALDRASRVSAAPARAADLTPRATLHTGAAAAAGAHAIKREKSSRRASTAPRSPRRPRPAAPGT